MKYSLILISGLIAGIFALASNPVRAQLAPVTIKDGEIMPLSYHDTIRLDVQDLIIRATEVEATFRFFNTGPTITQWVGLDVYHGKVDGWANGQKLVFSPAHYDRAPDNWRKYRYERLYWFRDNDYKCKHPNPNPNWTVSEVTFPSNASTTIRVRYPKSKDSIFVTEYGCGRYWKGRIGKAAFTIDRTEDGKGVGKYSFRDVSGCAGPREITKNLERYEFTDFEPDPDALFAYDYVSSRIDYRVKTETKQAQR
jgi:hypothetical protein